MMSKDSVVSSSFRDPSGFLYRKEGVLLRQINKKYRQTYDWFVKKLYPVLKKQELIVNHKEKPLSLAKTRDAYKIIQPDELPFISYPYEWSFSMLQDAALLTLEIMKIALDNGMILKDASAYNVQFKHGKPIFIDTLSFEKYEEGKPWVAYKQFCQHFLAPLALMSYVDIRLNSLLKEFIDGIPLDLAVNLLPLRAKAKLGLFLNLVLHAKSQSKYADIGEKVSVRKMSKLRLKSLVDSLESTIKKLKCNSKNTEWEMYYEKKCNYNQKGMFLL